MNYSLIKNVIELIEEFDTESENFTNNIEGFKTWFFKSISAESQQLLEPNWEGKENGRSPESTISTLLVHMSRYAKSYSKSAIHNSDFSTQDEFIYLITLKTFGEMSKIELIKKNVQDKPAGIQIINRLIKQGWVEQIDSEIDKRKKVISITKTGLDTLEEKMDNIRIASSLVTGNLSYKEKMQLITLLNKLNDFHKPIYNENFNSEDLLEQSKLHIKQ